MLAHASQVARSSGFEAIGWLLGFFSPDTVTVLDAAGATRYVSQSRYGAEADPREELEIATSYPRTVGIVGLYHSHPFSDETDHAIFHSQTDDQTLESRSSTREDYLSVVTDGIDAEVFLARGGKTEVSPEIDGDLTYRNVLKRYTCDVSMRVREALELAVMDSLLGALEREVDRVLDEALLEAEGKLDRERGVLDIPALTDRANRNAIRVTRDNGRTKVDLQIHTEVAVYLPTAAEAEVLSVLKAEIQDAVVYLLWHGLDAKALTGPVVDLDANLGSLRVQDTNPLPRKLYRPSKRPLLVKKGDLTVTEP